MRLRYAFGFMALAGALVAGCSDEPPEAGNLDNDDQSAQSDPDARDDTDNEPNDTDEDEDNADPDPEDDVIIEGDDDLQEVDAQTEADVEAFIEEFLDAQNTSTSTGDFSTEHEMIDSCRLCEESEGYIKEAYDSGGEVEGGLFTEPEISVGSAHNGRITVNVTSEISAYETTYGDGRPTDSGPAEEERFQYTVSETDGRWQIVDGRGLE